MLLLGIYKQINIATLIILLMFSTYGQAFIWSNTIALALKYLSSIADTAAALFSCLQMLLSAIISAVLAIPSDHTEFPLALAIFILEIAPWFIFQCTVFKTCRV